MIKSYKKYDMNNTTLCAFIKRSNSVIGHGSRSYYRCWMYFKRLQVCLMCNSLHTHYYGDDSKFYLHGL